MSARDHLLDRNDPEWNATVDKILAEHRDEVLVEITERLASRATLYGDSRTVNEVMRDLMRLVEQAEEALADPEVDERLVPGAGDQA